MRRSFPNSKLLKILKPAYNPCSGFSNTCQDMRWDPEGGHVPRGFRGCAGPISDVELVLVVAEPGDPLPGERHTGLESVCQFSMMALETGKTQFHRNLQYVLNKCWPGLTPAQRLKKVWLTESVLCSAKKEGGHVNASVWRECGQRYLLPQLEVFKDALVVALGKKAQKRLTAIGFQDYYGAWALAPPGCNRPEAKKSWDKIELLLRRHR